MFFSTLLIAAGLLVAETPDTLQAVTIVADKGVVVSRTDTLALRADGTAAQALLRFPGLSISDYGGLAGLKSVSLRGLGTAHTDIYLDGVRVSNFQSGQNDLGMLPMETLGSAVVDYAQNSVSFRTAKPVFGDRIFGGQVGLQAGSFGTWMPSARFDIKASERVSVSAHAAGVLTKGDFPYGPNGERRSGNDLRQIRAGADVFGVLDGGDWHAKAYYNASDRGTPGSLSWPSADRQQDKNFFLQGAFRKAFSDLYTLNLSAKAAWDDLFYKSEWGDSDYYFNDFQLNASHSFRLTDWWGVSLATDIERGSLKATGYDAARTAAIAALATAIRAGWFSADLAVEYRGTFDKGQQALNSVSSPSAAAPSAPRPSTSSTTPATATRTSSLRTPGSPTWVSTSTAACARTGRWASRWTASTIPCRTRSSPPRRRPTRGSGCRTTSVRWRPRASTPP